MLDDHCYLSEIGNSNSLNVLHKKAYCNVFINAIMAIIWGNVQMGDDWLIADCQELSRGLGET